MTSSLHSSCSCSWKQIKPKCFLSFSLMSFRLFTATYGLFDTLIRCFIIREISSILMHLIKSLNCESPIEAIKKLWNVRVLFMETLIVFFSKPNISSMHGRMIQRETRKSTNGVYRKEVFIFNSDVENNLQLGQFYEDCKKVITLLALDPPWTKIELLTR